MRRVRTLLVAAVVALGLVGVLAGPSFAQHQEKAATKANAVTRVTVTMTEYRFKFSRNSVPRGTVIFKVVNKGTIVHDLVIYRVNKKTGYIGPGKSRLLKVVFKKKGLYHYICSVGEHAFRGMQGNLRVR